MADSVENFVWLVEKGQEPKRLVSKFHGRWLTRDLLDRIQDEVDEVIGRQPLAQIARPDHRSVTVDVDEAGRHAVLEHPLASPVSTF